MPSVDVDVRIYFWFLLPPQCLKQFFSYILIVHVRLISSTLDLKTGCPGSSIVHDVRVHTYVSMSCSLTPSHALVLLPPSPNHFTLPQVWEID